APADLWRDLWLGIREARPRDEGARRRAIGVQHRPVADECRGGRPWAWPSPRRSREARDRRRPADPRARRLVRAVCRLSPVLSEPAAADTGVCRAGGGAAVSKMRLVIWA